MKNLQELTSLVNKMSWSYSHNGMADTSKLEAGVNHLNNATFTELDVENAIDNHGFINVNDEIREIAEQIAANLGADKLRTDKVYYDMYDENGSFELN